MASKVYGLTAQWGKETAFADKTPSGDYLIVRKLNPPAPQPPAGLRVPDLTGLSVPAAHDMASLYGVRLEVKGDRNGVIHDQSPKPGTTLLPGGVIEGKV